jgi:serine/threonine protein kinase
MKVAETLTGITIAEKYKLTELLGEGSSGSTYRAICLSNESLVAVKILSLRHLKDWKQLELFEREAKVLSQLKHPQIPQYLEYFHVDTQENRAFYIVQQFAPGKPLSDWVQSGWRGTEAEIKDIARQLLEILQYLHQQSPPIIHRDIKPQNIIRNDDGQIFLVDFGAVQNVYQNTLLKGSTVAGTYGYMAPEQFRGAAMPASDLYGLGATVLYLLTHRSPADLPQERLKMSFRDHVNISQQFTYWLELMVEPDIDIRFPTVKEALKVLCSENISLAKPNRTQKKIPWIGALTSTIAITAMSLLYFNRYAFFIMIGIPPHDFCSEKVKVSSLKEYLKNGGSANAEMHLEDNNDDHSDLPLLHCSVLLGQAEIVEILLKNGAEPNSYSFTKIRGRGDTRKKISTPLHQAIYSSRKNSEIIAILIKYGGNADMVDRFGNTPLQTLIKKGRGFGYQDIQSIKMLILLVDQKLNLKRDKNGCIVDDQPNSDAVEMISSYQNNYEHSEKDGDTTLRILARQENLALANYFIKQGWNPLLNNQEGATAAQLIQEAKMHEQQCKGIHINVEKLGNK